MTAPDVGATLELQLRRAVARRDRAEERVRELRDKLADAHREYGQADQEVYRLRQQERGRHYAR